MSNMNIDKETMNIVFVGHVDHGKSTIVGRLLHDTDSLPKGKLERVRKNCERNSKPFEYAFLIDALKDEQSQGITIDSARIFFKTDKRYYIILDAPGHIEFLKNMITGASHAEAAFLVIDAREGVKENSRRHGYMLKILGIQQIAVLISKMDLVDYRQEVFNDIEKEYLKFLTDIGIEPMTFIPVSGINGDNLSEQSMKMKWYQGKTLLNALDDFKKDEKPVDKDLRIPIQDIYKFSKSGDNRRIIAGKVESGVVKVGDELFFYPSGKKSFVKSIECFHGNQKTEVTAGYNVGFTLNEQIYVKRGEIACRLDQQKPNVSTRLQASLFWLGKEPMRKNKEYLFKIGTERVSFRIEEITRIIDASSLIGKKENYIQRHEVADCIIKLKREIAFDLIDDFPSLGRFVIVDNYEISGGGIIREALPDEEKWVRDKAIVRDYKWAKSGISQYKRSEKYNQRSTLILITGKKDSGKKPLARELERNLFHDGKIIYFLGIGNILYGVDADIKGSGNRRQEHVRRLAEVANIMLDAGIILIVTAIELTAEDLHIIHSAVRSDFIEVVWLGKKKTTDVPVDLQLEDRMDQEGNVDLIKKMIQEKGIIYKPRI